MSGISEVDWQAAIRVLAAALTPTVAIVGLAVGILNHRLAKKRRDDDLFDRRYEFYKKIRGVWLSTGSGAPPGSDPTIDTLDLIPLAEEADFLFGDDIPQHIMDLDRKGHHGHPDFPNEEFIKPFRIYLRFGRR
jgi:hypothetical protein